MNNMKALVFDKSKYDWATSRGFYPSTNRLKPPVQGKDLVEISSPVSDGKGNYYI
jgi:hypothetical protein